MRCDTSHTCPPHPDLVKRKLVSESDDRGGRGGGGGASINNTVMVLRTICNHPLLRWGRWPEH